MVLVMSHAWTLDEGAHRAAYVDLTDRFEELHRAQRGFRGRRLVRDLADGRHFVNLRWWDALEDYEALVADPAYPGWIARLSEHVEARDPEKSVFVVALDHPDPAAGALPS